MKLTCALVSLLLTLSASSGHAASMFCVDSGKSFKVVFDPASKSTKSSLPGSDFKITSIAGQIVSGTTVEDGPSFRALFEGQKRLEYYYHGKLMQTLPFH